MSRRVRGHLFLDYVRMVRGRKDVDWSRYLDADDCLFLDARIDPRGWYPMATFERLGLGILHEIGHGQLEGARMWGRFQVVATRKQFPELVAEGEPRETLMRFRILGRGFFDFPAVEVDSVEENEALVVIDYRMSKLAEETACWQSRGFFEGLLEAAGASEATGRFLEQGWDGTGPTRLALHWTDPATGPSRHSSS